MSNTDAATFHKCPQCMQEIKRTSFLKRLLSGRLLNYSSQPWLFKINKTHKEKMYGSDPEKAFFLSKDGHGDLIDKLHNEWKEQREEDGVPYLVCRFCGLKFKESEKGLIPFDYELPLYKKWWLKD